MGLPSVAHILVEAGVSSLADSRLENIQTILQAGIKAPITLIRSPKIDQAAQVVRDTTMSLNTELEVISALSKAAKISGQNHDVLLMVELGDLREGIMPCDLEEFVGQTLLFPNITLKGIGANLACRCGISPDDTNMSELSNIADKIEATFGPVLPIISGGNSSNLNWALGSKDIGRINNLRIGEAILLGCEPLHRLPIKGLHTDAITLVAEVIESKLKLSKPWGKAAEAAFGVTNPPCDIGPVFQSILAIGHMDTDPEGLTPPSGINILGASSDHLIIRSDQGYLPIGTEICFQINYSSLIRAMASPFVTKRATPINPAFVAKGYG